VEKVEKDIKKQIVKQVFTFLLITTLISTGIFIWIFNGAGDSLAAVLPMMFTPGIAAIITARIYRESIGSFGWKLGDRRYLVYAYILPIIVSIIGYGLVWMTQYGAFTAEQVVNYRWAKMLGFKLPAPFVAGLFSKLILAFLVTLFFVFGEEVGWSGYLTPKLRRVFSIPATSLIVGVYWAVWHYPAIIGGFYGTGTPLYIALPGFTLVLVGASFVRTAVVDKSKSLWPGVVLHASHNVILMGIFHEMTKDTGPFPVNYLVSETGLFLGCVYILIGILFWRLVRKKM
jgi:membrane protease YdiL (CAAX protease family)